MGWYDNGELCSLVVTSWYSAGELVAEDKERNAQFHKIPDLCHRKRCEENDDF